MNEHFELRLDGFGGACFCVEDDPCGGVLIDEQLRGVFSAYSLDEFWLWIRNR